MNEHAAAGAGEGDDQLWQSALHRFEQERRSQLNAEDESAQRREPVAHFEVDSPPQTQDDQYRDTPSTLDNDSSLTRDNTIERLDAIDRLDGMGDMEMYYDQPSAGAGRPDEESPSLRRTLRALHEQDPMIKYYALGLLILLVATAAIIGVSVAQGGDPPAEDCSPGSYDAFLLLPEESPAVEAAGFGASLSASPEYLVVGAPGSACGGPSCNGNGTVGGGAYLYRRTDKREWALYSTFILDDGLSAGDEFGKSVAISHDSRDVVVGAPKDDRLGIVAGAIYVMEQPFASTTPPIRLTPSDLGFNDQFGGSVSISATALGDADSSVRVTNIVAGALLDDDSGAASGGVYVFSRFDGDPPAGACGGGGRAGKWAQCQKLLPDDGAAGDQFGRMVDASGRTIIVGAMGDDDQGANAGAAYVYSLDDGGSWAQQEKLLPRNFYSQGNRFGASVATSGRRIVVGADGDDALGDRSGAAYVFDLSNGAWGLTSKLVPAKGAEDHDGYACGGAVSISDDGGVVVVGCPGGRLAYVYSLQDNGITWAQAGRLTVPGRRGVADSRMGSSVAQSEDAVVVGYGQSNGDVFSFSRGC